LSVRNALGVVIGPLVGPSHVMLTLPTGRRSYAEVHRDVAPVDWAMMLFYESNNCSGTPFVSWNSVEELVAPTLVRQWGAWAVVPGTTQIRTMRSSRMHDASGLSPVCQVSQTTTFTSGFEFFTLEQLQLVGPLTVD
jgi:hypothetical protein